MSEACGCRIREDDWNRRNRVLHCPRHAEATVARLEEGLRTYGQHRWKCAKLAAIVEVGVEGDHEAARLKAAGLPCTCGFDHLLTTGGE